MLSTIPPSLLAGIELSLFLFGGLALVLVGWRMHARRRRPDTTVAPNLVGVAAGGSADSRAVDPNASFFGGNILPAGSARTGSHARSPRVRTSAKTGVLPMALMLVGALLVGFACYHIYRNATKDLSDFGMPDSLFGRPSAGLGSVIGKDIEDINTKHDVEGMDTRGALYGSPSNSLGVVIMEGPMVQSEKRTMASSLEPRFHESGGGWVGNKPIQDWGPVDAGPMGGSVRCGFSPDGDASMCIWVSAGDGDALGIFFLTGPRAYLAAEDLIHVRQELGV